MEPTRPAEKILFVDDDPNILASFLRQLRRKFVMDTALGASKAVEMAASQGPYAVLVSDFKMPGIDGVELLRIFREQSPDTVRILLTGYADLETAIRAVNEGNIFRLLTKPIEMEDLVRALVAGIKQHRLVTAEREILQQTLAGSVKVMSEILSLLHPAAMGRATRIQDLVAGIAAKLGLEHDWTLTTAALLCQIGMVVMPPDSLQRLLDGEELTAEDQQIYEMHPMIAHDLLKHIPRLEEVSRIIALQEKHYDGSGPPPGGEAGEDIPLGARILKVALDFDLMQGASGKREATLQEMRGRKGWYDRRVLTALGEHLAAGPQSQERLVSIKDLTENMVLAQDVLAYDGRIMVPRGYEVSRMLVSRLLAFHKNMGIREPIKVVMRTEG